MAGGKQVVTELEVLFTADTSAVDKAGKTVKTAAEAIEKKPIEATVTADPADALAGMERVEQAAKKIVSADTVATVDANIDRAQKQLDHTQKRLDYLRSVETELDVSADIKRAEKQLHRIERQRDGLVAARATMEIVADTSKAEAALDKVKKPAAKAGDDAGKAFGGKILDAIGSIPVAGAVAVIGAGAAAALLAAFKDGLQQEAGRDRLQALTGIDEAEARRLANAAGEAYASTFGESIEANMDTARIATQYKLIDPAGTTRDSQKVIQGLAGIADVLGEDVAPVSRAVSQMLRTGLVKSADQAFDVLATGAREGVNASEDLLDTFIEYGTHFRDLGLSADEALGLLNQGLEGGAFNADKVADAMKELTIRVKEGGKDSTAALKELGLKAGATKDAFNAGGTAARDAFDSILTGLEDIKDPVDRNRLAIALFGTQAEDMAQALGNLDLSTAVDQLTGVEGAAKRMFDTIAENDATKMEEAKRNIEVAADGMKGALAIAFSEPLGDLADWVTENRGPLLQFFADLVNGAFDFAIGASQAVGEFVSGPLAAMIEGLAAAIDWMNGSDPVPQELLDLSASMRDFSSTTDDATARMEGWRAQFNGFADEQIALGNVHDAAKRTAGAVDDLGIASDGSKMELEGLKASKIDASEAGRRLDEQLQTVAGSLEEELRAAAEAGESQENLAERYLTTRDALRDQLDAMGVTKKQAEKLIDTYLGVPGKISTDVEVPGTEVARGLVAELHDEIDKLPRKKQAKVRALLNSGDIPTVLDELGRVPSEKKVTIRAALSGDADGFRLLRENAKGGLLEFMAGGGLRGHGLTPMQPVAQMVPPNTWRVVGDRGDVTELYTPLDGSARSWMLLLEGLRRMPGTPPQMMAAGGLVGATPTSPSGAGPTIHIENHGVDAAELAARTEAQLDHWMRNLATDRR